MNTKTANAIETVFEYLRDLASKNGSFVSRLDISICGDGRIAISAEDGPITRAREEAYNGAVSGPLQRPSAAICDLRDKLHTTRSAP